MRISRFTDHGVAGEYDYPVIPTARWEDAAERTFFEASHDLGRLSARFHVFNSADEASLQLMGNVLTVAKSVAYDQRKLGIEVVTGRVDRDNTQMYMAIGSDRIDFSGTSEFVFPDFVDNTNGRLLQLGQAVLLSR
jgi:hypothetical protein